MVCASLSEGGRIQPRRQSLAELLGDIFVLNKMPFGSALSLGGKPCVFLAGDGKSRSWYLKT